MKKFPLFIAVFLLAIQTTHAAVISTILNDQNYDWLSLDLTIGKSRTEVEALTLDMNSELYGYQYASRQQVADLFLFYAYPDPINQWDGTSGWKGEETSVSGVFNLFNDFGATQTTRGSFSTSTYTTGDGFDVNISSNYDVLNAYYGDVNDNCNVIGGASCFAELRQYYGSDLKSSAMFLQNSHQGWSLDSGEVDIRFATNDLYTASFLVKPSVVPLPAAGWLFATALIGFFAANRRRKES